MNWRTTTSEPISRNNCNWRRSRSARTKNTSNRAYSHRISFLLNKTCCCVHYLHTSFLLPHSRTESRQQPIGSLPYRHHYHDRIQAAVSPIVHHKTRAAPSFFYKRSYNLLTFLKTPIHNTGVEKHLLFFLTLKLHLRYPHHSQQER